MKYIHVFVTGRVQGVFFRAFTKKSADDCDIKGWVRNLPDGRVEAFACGDKEKIDTFITQLKKGPPASRVENIEILAADAKEEFSDFSILHT